MASFALLRYRGVVAVAAVAVVAGACSSTTTATPTTVGPTTEAPTPTTVAPATEAPTTEAPTTTTIEAPAPSSIDLAAYASDLLGDSPGGLAALTVRHGVTNSVAVGSANQDGDPLAPDAPFRVASVSKTFVATMIMQMVEEGLVDLDAPAETYLPGVPIGRDAKVRSLLDHTSGLADYADSDDLRDDVFADPSRPYSPGEALDVAAHLEPATPGEYHYSNTNYILLGLIIVTIDDRPLNNSLAARITEPLGLESTRFATEADAPDGIPAVWSQEYNFDGDPSDTYQSISSLAWSAAGLVSTTQDLATFLAALFDGQLVSPGSLAQMTDLSNSGYGLGLTQIDSGVGSVLLGHDGILPGFLSVMAIDQDTGDIIVVFSNDDSVEPWNLILEITRNW